MARGGGMVGKKCGSEEQNEFEGKRGKKKEGKEKRESDFIC